MLELLGPRQEAILRLLAKCPGGLTIEDLADRLRITRVAVSQHLIALERDGYLVRAALRPTGGRPGQVFQLSDRGRDLFPRRYSWFSGLLLESLRDEVGAEGLAARLVKIAERMLPALKNRVSASTMAQRWTQSAALLGELGYETEDLDTTPGPSLPVLEATNCPYHDLARQYPEICAFDLRLLEGLVESEIAHDSCMARGDATCRFRIP